MKKITLLFYLLTLIVNSQKNFKFENLSNLNFKRGLISTTSTSKFLFASNGFTPNTSFSSDIEMYNIQEDKWTILSDLTIPKRFASIEAIGNNIYLFNGVKSGSFNYNEKLEKINISSGNISFLADNPFPVKSAGNCIWNNEIYFFGGSNASGYSNKLIKYNLENDNWIELKEMPIAKETAGEVVDGKIYAIGGFNGESGLKSIDSYDIDTDSWEQLINLPNGVSAHSTAVYDKKILVVGDYIDQTNIGYYDIETNSYVSCTSNMIGRRHFGAEIVNENLYVIGGNQTPSASSSLNSLQQSNLSTTLSVLQNELITTKVYPNPTSNYLNVITTNFVDKVEIVNIEGKNVVSFNDLSLKSKLNISKLEKGIYFVTIKTKNSLITKKIIKE